MNLAPSTRPIEGYVIFIDEHWLAKWMSRLLLDQLKVKATSLVTIDWLNKSRTFSSTKQRLKERHSWPRRLFPARLVGFIKRFTFKPFVVWLMCNSPSNLCNISNEYFHAQNHKFIYYSFKIFLLFWLAQMPRFILHNQLALTKFAINGKWRR